MNSRQWNNLMAQAGAIWDVDPDLLARVLTGHRDAPPPVSEAGQRC